MKFIGKNVHDLESIFRAKTSIGVRHFITMNVPIRFADSSDNTIITQLNNVTIPGNAIITCIAAVVTQVSNLSTHLVNIQVGDVSGQAADATVTHGVEILGAGVANTDSTDSASAEDIDLKNDLNEVWICRDTVRLDGNADYIYICNAGTGNGTTNSTAGELAVTIEYYGIN